MEKKSKIAVIGTIAVILITVIVLGITIVKKLTPSNEVMLLTDYYQVEDSEVLVILQNKIYEKSGLLLDGKVYLDYETIKDKFNHRFYWDSNENILTYTTPNEIIQAESGRKHFTVTKSMIKTDSAIDYPVVKVFADQVYIALDFVAKYSDMEYEYYVSPNRVVINYQWGDYLFTEVTKETQLRKDPNIKSPILTKLAVGTSLYVDMDEAPQKGFSKVMTKEGIIGYVRDKYVKESFYKTISSDFKEPEYTSQTRPEKINLVFHQVFNEDAADNLENLIAQTKGLDVVVPTWFSVIDNSGNVSSLASERYVEKAKSLGLEVWALVDDFNTEISMYEVLSHTSSRENLSNVLVEAALKYKLNGINIDFEKISSDAGIHYIQFLRELSVKCRNNGIVLSVDNYVPSPYTSHYDREEQGKILDYVIVMAYDEYYAGSEVAGPVASLGFVKDAVTNILTMVPKEKTIIAIPFYTRLWKETPDGEVSSESFSMTPAENILKENEVEPKWNDTYGCYYAEYERDGATYRMWQEEDKSIEEKLKVIYNADVAGIAAWKLGLEKESTWNVITRYFE
ncbi:MAG: glycosyl hydrolase family 18 [Clostridiales bacterium]|nr:glycosyl hydrolase family 18 [Clostridiales bacterium]